MRVVHGGNSGYDPVLYEQHVRYGTGNSLEIILKVAERCNIACRYCYFFFGGDESYKDNPAYIANETIADFAAFIKDAVDVYGIERLRLIIHGGEPLMIKKSRMENLLESIS